MNSDRLAKIKDNIDTIIISAVLSGLIGYFSGIISVNNRIADVNTKIEKLTTYIDINKEVLDNGKAIRTDIDFLKKQNEIGVQTNQLLSLRIEQERTNMVAAIKEIIKGKW